MHKIFILLILFSSMVFGDESSYWELEIPVMEGAKYIERNKDEQLYIVTTSYTIEIDNTQEPYSFYEQYFESLGWENPFENHSRFSEEDEFRGKWSASRSGFNENEKPESSYSSSWKSQLVPVNGNVLLKLTGYKNNKFLATVEISITPEIDQSSFYGIFELLKNPINLFILSEATGGNPFAIDSIDLEAPEKHEDHEAVKKYYSIIQEISKKYEEFGNKYVTK